MVDAIYSIVAYRESEYITTEENTAKLRAWVRNDHRNRRNDELIPRSRSHIGEPLPPRGPLPWSFYNMTNAAANSALVRASL